MKWLHNNLPGAILATTSGLLLLISLLLGFLGTLPVSSGTQPGEGGLIAVVDQQAEPVELGPLGEYRVVTDRPVFNETRRPAIEFEEAGLGEEEQAPAEVTEPPKLSLTGVVITPDVSLATLTPEGGGEALVLREGERVTGEHTGWSISKIYPRKVFMESAGGDIVNLDLAVHDQQISLPPRPRPQQPAPEEVAPDVEAEDAAMSRAEEIRQRIAERREQLRAQAEAGGPQEAEPSAAVNYKNAIQNLMNSGRNRKGGEKDDED